MGYPEGTAGDDAVRFVIESAFAGARHADGNEAELVGVLRKGKGFVPQLSPVAEVDGRIAGAGVTVGGKPVVALVVLSVLPEYQGQGIGCALTREGHRVARVSGYGFSVGREAKIIIRNRGQVGRGWREPARDAGAWGVR